MTIEQLLRMKQLSEEIQTKCPESWKELQELIRQATAELISNTYREPVCELCVNFKKCRDELPRLCLFTTPKYRNFELRMDSEGGDAT